MLGYGLSRLYLLCGEFGTFPPTAGGGESEFFLAGALLGLGSSSESLLLDGASWPRNGRLAASESICGGREALPFAEDSDAGGCRCSGNVGSGGTGGSGDRGSGIVSILHALSSVRPESVPSFDPGLHTWSPIMAISTSAPHVEHLSAGRKCELLTGGIFLPFVAERGRRFLSHPEVQPTRVVVGFERVAGAQPFYSDSRPLRRRPLCSGS